jgi:hypothetical protein
MRKIFFNRKVSNVALGIIAVFIYTLPLSTQKFLWLLEADQD